MNQKYINKKKVAVLLSTYNGMKYLPQLVESILKQTCRDFSLYIRDDGSTDDTLEYIRNLSNTNSCITLIERGGNLGSKKSFLFLTDIVQSEYYMYSDQDDVWKDSKIEDCLKCIRELEYANPNKPIVVHTDLELVDGDLALISPSYWDFCNIPVDMPHTYHLMRHFNDVTGCAMIFNKEAKNVSLPFFNLELPKFIYHDCLIALLTAKNNGIVYALHKQTMWFRRHGGNETNPLLQKKSILERPYMIISFFKDQYRRYKFFKQIDNGSFFSFEYYKLLTYLIQKKWKRKLV